MRDSSTLTYVQPEDVGVPSCAVEAFLDALAAQGLEVHSYMLLRHGRVASKGWWAPYAPEYPHMLYSLSKSFTATAAGLAMEEGLFHLDDTVISHFPDEAPKRPQANLAAMRVRDLLCMATGHVTEPDDVFSSRAPHGAEKRFLSHPVEKQPGTHFLYNSIATYMVASLVQRKTGEKLVDYLLPRLFEPLGIERPLWEENRDGVAFGGWGLNLKTEDIAKFGQLMLQQGMWQGKQLVPRHWVRLMTSWQIDNSQHGEGNWAEGYGFQFWRCRDDCYRGDGMFGQYCLVMPHEDAVLAVTSGEADMGKILDCALAHLRPAMAQTLPPNPEAAAKLAAREAALALPAPPASEGEDIAPQLLGKAWKVAVEGQREEDYPTVTLHKRKAGYVAEMHLQHKVTIKLGTDRPERGHTTLISPEKRLYLATAGIDKQGGVRIRIALPETPYRVEVDIVPHGKAGAKGFSRLAPNGKPMGKDAYVVLTEQ